MSLIKSLKITWLSPHRLRDLSCGEITSPKTINARTWKPELGGLFDPRVFGPFLNYECYCGKYKGKQNKGQKCERCEVLVAEKNLQRWRMGHIPLVSPVTNILIFKSLAPQLSKLLGISTKNLTDIIYCRAYVVLDSGLANCVRKKDILAKKIDSQLLSTLLDEIITRPTEKNSVIAEAQQLKEKIPDSASNQPETLDLNTVFLEDYLEFIAQHHKMKISTGSEVLQALFREINLEKELIQAQTEKKKAKISFIRSLLNTKIQLEWMIINNLPIIPCGLRPIVKLKDNTVAATQLDNLYYKIILVNERLKHCLDFNKKLGVFFSEIIHNEKRRLQKAVERLMAGSELPTDETKSLLQSLSGKEGILRRYSLGKRVDYSARSVIVPNPQLSLNQVGLPITIALILYQPFLLHKILKEKMAFTTKEAEQLLAQKDPVIFPLLSEIMAQHPLLVNRAPSLHRLSLQGFYPQLTLGKSLELHPLVTTAFNADFDGDQMAVHLPLTPQACQEINDYVLASKQILDPKNGSLITVPSKDIILGIYYLTQEKKSSQLLFYESWESLWQGHERGQLSVHDLIVVPAVLAGRGLVAEKNKFLLTTLGKLIFNQILPASFLYYVNNLENYAEISPSLLEVNEISTQWKNHLPQGGWQKKDIIAFLDYLVKEVTPDEMVIFCDQLKKIGFDYATLSGLSISPFELEEIVAKENDFAQAHQQIAQITAHFRQGFYSPKEVYQKKIATWAECKDNLEAQLITNLSGKKDTSFYALWDSGARASSENLTQIFAMRGNTTNYLGEIIETPILSSLWEGLTPNEFFISVYGAIKGITDTALKTAEAGYLTRRLVEASQSVIITASDCRTTSGTLLTENSLLPWSQRVYGRYLAQDVNNSSGEIIFLRNTILWTTEIEKLAENKVNSFLVRSVLNCELLNGVCQKCYGADLSRQEEAVSLGTAVGIIAAQSLGEPGTQLTMRTFHTGGIAGEEDIIQGLPKVKQIFDNIQPKKEEKAVLAQQDGVIIDINESTIKQLDPQGQEIVYVRPPAKSGRVLKGEKVACGAKLTSGKIDLAEYLTVMGREHCQNYIKAEIQKVYYNQGIDINEKHIEIFARQMLSKVEVTNSGDSDYLKGDIVGYQVVQKTNQSLIAKQKKLIQFRNIISSLKDLASAPNSFLAGISFQNTLKNLINYSLYQPVDYLQGVKENLIAGQLVPVGTGFQEREKYQHRKTEKI